MTIGYDEDLEEINRDQADAEADHSIYELSDDSSFAHIMNVSSINP
ncbi:hypothetical protein [Salicibibacter halophilus]|nr:hypothetical protein [Salicibibacter halophilus]